MSKDTEQNDDSFPIDIMVKSFGNWALGYGWVTLTIGGAKATGLALYARHTGRNGEMREPMRRVVANFRDATNWLLDVAKVPNRPAGKLMAEAMDNGDFGDITKNDARIATATPPATCPTCDGEGVIENGTRRCPECQDGEVIRPSDDLLESARQMFGCLTRVHGNLCEQYAAARHPDRKADLKARADRYDAVLNTAAKAIAKATKGGVA